MTEQSVRSTCNSMHHFGHKTFPGNWLCNDNRTQKKITPRPTNWPDKQQIKIQRQKLQCIEILQLFRRTAAKTANFCFFFWLRRSEILCPLIHVLYVRLACCVYQVNFLLYTVQFLLGHWVRATQSLNFFSGWIYTHCQQKAGVHVSTYTTTLQTRRSIRFNLKS